MSLHPGHVPMAISEYSDHENESEILIAASSGFMIDEIEWIDIRLNSESGFRELKITHVRLSYFVS
jgi:hypothetical protein